VVVAAWSVHAQITGQTPVPNQAPTGPVPRMPDGKPDLSGVWQRPYTPDMSRNGRGQMGYAEPPFTPADSAAKREELKKAGNFNANAVLDTVGHPQTDALQMIQTLRRTDAGHIAYTVTIDDPKAYTKPWKNERTFTLMSTEIIEYSCEENNKDLAGGHIKFW